MVPKSIKPAIFLFLLAAVLGSLSQSVAAQTFIDPLPPSASNFASDIDTIFYIILGFTGFFFFLVIIVLITFIIRYRAKKPGEEGINFHGHMGLEVAWTIVPAVIFIAIAILSAGVLTGIDHPPDNAMPIGVEAKQFGWKFVYADSDPTDDIDDSVTTTNSMYMPVNYPVKLFLSAEDVLHSFWVPAFRVKQDAVPGLPTTLWFEATASGEYPIKCAELCGAGHSQMLGKVYVLSQSEFDQWLAGERQKKAGASEEVARGQALYEQQCFACHSTDGTRGAGPSWLDLYGSSRTFDDGTTAMADDEYIVNSIRNPGLQVVETFQNIMPAFAASSITDADIQDLIEYMKTITSGSADSTGQTDTTSQGDSASGQGDTSSDPAEPSQTGDTESGGENLVALGEQLAQSNCIFCHTIDGNPLVGPTWLGLYGKSQALTDGSTVTVDDAYIINSIRDPNSQIPEGFSPAMPPFPQISDNDVQALLAYIKSLSN